jgi:hypothetical protein
MERSFEQRVDVIWITSRSHQIGAESLPSVSFPAFL